jgi:DNA-binding LytR/AlgR family response regulator
MSIHCLILEDQLPAQRILARFIADLPHLELVALCGNAFEAMNVLHRQDVDLMFLDINLPKLQGFEFLRSLASPPKVIVTTAYAEHAVEAFDLQVADYLVKPIAFERFIKAVDRARAAIAKDVGTGARQPEAIKANEFSGAEEIFVKVDGEHRRIALADIIFLRAEGDYTSIVTNNDRLFASGSIARWGERLPGDRFVRTHKSYIVNLSHAERVTPSTIAAGNSGLPIGRRYRDQLRKRLGLSNAQSDK